MKIESLPVLVLNPHSRCNCRCAMCDIWKATGVQELSEADLERQLDSIRRLDVRWVVLTGGEPLMHSNLWRLCAVIRKADVRLTLLSSGLLLARYARQIVDHVDDVIVSLDGPPPIHDSIRGVAGAFRLLAAGVEELRALHPGFGISARCTVQRSNFQHLTAAMEAALVVRLNSISFLAADLESAAFNRSAGWSLERQQEIGLDAEAVRGLEAEMELLIGRGVCGAFVRESPAGLRRIVRHFRAHLRDAVPVSPVCNAPWTSAVVEADGSVRPCFFHKPIGNLRTGQELEQILNGPQALAFRQSLQVAENPICQKCVCSLNWRSTPATDPGRVPANSPASSRPRDNSPADTDGRQAPSQPSPLA